MQVRHMVSVVAVLAICMSGSASADMFVDVIDTWNVLGVPSDSVPIVEGFPLSYTHDLRDNGIPAGYSVTDASLELDFTNDFVDGYFTKEYASVAAWNPATSTWDTFANLGEVDNDAYGIVLQTGLITDINADGLLGIQISITNNTIGLGTAWLDQSKLTVMAQPTPVPGAVLLGWIGLGYAAVKLRKTV